MVRGKLGVPRPLLSQSCGIRINAVNTGEDSLDPLLETIKSMGGGFEFTIEDSGVIQHGTNDIFPDSVYVDVGNNRVPFDDLSMIAELFADKTDKRSNESSITVEAIVNNNTRIPRPLVDRSVPDSDIVLEVNTMAPASVGNMKKLKKEFFSYGSLHTYDGGMIIDTNRHEITIDTLYDIAMYMHENGMDYRSIIIACAMREIKR